MRAWVVEMHMSNKYEINQGPFDGTELDTSKLVTWRYSDGNPVIFNGREMREWTPDYLTPIFLGTFDPMLGWAVTTDMIVMEGLKLPDFGNPLVENGVVMKNAFGGDLPTMLQVLKFTAALTDPTGKVVHSVSILQGVNNLNSADLGMKRVLLQLYRGMGLPSAPDGDASSVVVHQKPADSAATSRAQTQTQQPAKAVAAQGFVVRPISQVASEAEGDDRDVSQDVTGTGESLPEPEQTVDLEAAASETQAEPVQAALVVSPEQENNPDKDQSSLDNGHIDTRLLQQITHYARLVGEDVRRLNDDNDGKSELVRLRRLANKR